MANGKRKHAFGANSKSNICEQISSYLILSFGSSKGCLLGIVFSAACSLSLTLPLYSNGSGLVSCAALALPLGVLVFVILSFLARFSLKPGECERSRNSGTRLFAFAAVSFVAIWVVLGLAPLYPGCFSTDSVDILKMALGCLSNPTIFVTILSTIIILLRMFSSFTSYITPACYLDSLKRRAQRLSRSPICLCWHCAVALSFVRCLSFFFGQRSLSRALHFCFGTRYWFGIR